MPAEPLCVLTLETGAEPACLPRVHRLVDDLAQRLPDLADSDRRQFETAVVEVAGNIVEHGGVGVRLQLRVNAYRDRLEACFCDTGCRPELQSPPEMPHALAEAGRGLALAAAVVDELVYERAGSTNHWRVVQRRAA